MLKLSPEELAIAKANPEGIAQSHWLIRTTDGTKIIAYASCESEAMRKALTYNGIPWGYTQDPANHYFGWAPLWGAKP